MCPDFCLHSTPYILDANKLEKEMAKLKYIVTLPSDAPQPVLNAFFDQNIDITARDYKKINSLYNTFKNTIIYMVKQIPLNIIDTNIHQALLSVEKKGNAVMTSVTQ